MPYSYVRIGSLAELHLAECNSTLPRGRRVIVRTTRGVELGEVIRASTEGNPGFDDPESVGPSSAQRDSKGDLEWDGSAPPESTLAVPQARVLRPTTDEDELLIRRLERHKRDAVEACREALSQAGSTAMLLDVDQLFDGGTLVMHFLGPVDEIASSITKEVADRYESIVRSRHFAKLLADGCGPDCGQKEGDCGGVCAGCAVSSVCQSH